MPEILALRHGKCELNKAGRLNGQIDSDLAMEGEQQGRDLGAYLGSHVARRLIRMPDIVYSSTLRRASQTSRFTTDALGLQPALELPALRERCLGEVEGMTYAEALAHVPDKYKITTPHGVTYAQTRKFGFETFKQTTKRARGVLDYMERTHKEEDDTAWLHTHGDFIEALVAAWTGRPMKDIIQELYLGNTEGVWLHPDMTYTKFVPDIYGKSTASTGEIEDVIRLPHRVA
jgi:probable phosphoglycerate mutase